jgi:ABC-type microcin C transport system permease subunit YejE
MDQLGKMLVFVGLGIATLGAILWLGQGIPWLRLGKLPGDISYQKDGFSVYVPITTLIALSVLLTLVFWIVNAVRR